jgi:ribosomal protein S18 acetylase RimI-like enzyme
MVLTDEDLREAASHRGLKLVKSRKRKPGVGDFGLFGLADSTGKPLFGMDGDTLTATPEQIADYLRKGEASTWAQSAKITPQAKPKPAAEMPAPEKADDAPSAIRPRTRRKETARRREDRPRRRPDRNEDTEDARPGPTSAEAIPVMPTPAPKAKAKPDPAPELAPEPERELTIRAARAGDAEALRALLATSGGEASVAELKRGIAAAGARKEPVIVADRGGAIGCLAWHLVPTLDHCTLARITMIAVAKEERRQGVGKALYDAALTEFRKRKVRVVEAMSDIEVRNANGFYRRLGLKQASYRFAVDL